MAQKYYSSFESLALGAASPDFAAVTGAWKVVAHDPVTGSQAYGLDSGDGLLVYLSGIAAQADMAVQLSQTVRLGSASNSHLDYANVCPIARADAAMQNFYMANPQLLNGELRIYKSVAGSFTDISGTPAALPFTPTEGQVFLTKIEASGTTIRARVWLAGSSEPSTWLLSVTDSSVTAAGYGGVRSGTNTGAGAPTFDDFYAGDPGTAFAPPAPPPPPVVLLPSDPKLFRVRQQWRAKGQAIRTNNSGAFVRFRFVGSTGFTLTNDMANAAPVPLRYSLNGGTFQNVTMATTNVVSGLDGGTTYEVAVWVPLLTQAGDRWTASATNVWDLVSVSIDAGGTFSAPSSLAQSTLVYMDSLGENGDALENMGYAIGQAFGMEPALRAFGGTGLGTNNDGGSVAAVGTVPTLAAACDRYDSSTSLDFTGVGAVVVCMGINDQRAGASDASIQAGLQTAYGKIRAGVGPSVPIYWCVPVGGQARASILAKVDALKATDAQLFLGDGPDVAGLMGDGHPIVTYVSVDGYHPSAPYGTALATSALGKRVASGATAANVVLIGL